MQLNKKLITLGVIIVALVLISTTGCTTTTTPSPSPTPVTTKTATQTTVKVSSSPSPTPTPTSTATPTPTPSGTSIEASEFNKKWQGMNQDDTIVTPFAKSVNEKGHVVFIGVTKSRYSWDGDNTTFEVCKDQADAQQTYQQTRTQATQAGYTLHYENENKTVTAGYKEIPNNTELVNAITISWVAPNGYGIGYYVETVKFLAPP